MIRIVRRCRGLQDWMLNEFLFIHVFTCSFFGDILRPCPGLFRSVQGFFLVKLFVKVVHHSGNVRGPDPDRLVLERHQLALSHP